LARALRQQKEFDLSKQVVRAGTSIGANVEEALAGISRRDFVARMSVASQEARETHYWLQLIQDSKVLSPDIVSPMLKDADELVRMLTAIVKTTQNGTSPKTKHSQLKTHNSKDSYA
jgi:four helix bundle protein